MTGDLLAAVVAASRRSADWREARGSVDIEAAAEAGRPRAERFVQTLSAPGVRVIAECKRRSPSRGVLREAYDPAAIASGYARAGAAAISVLTEPTFFDGSLAHLEAVRKVVGDTPVLRKDFIVTEFQLLEARAAGADAVLLIVAALGPPDLRRLLDRARALGLAVLAEAHDEGEVARAVDAGATVVGVNSRNLRTLEVDLGLFDRVAPGLPTGVVAVAESGLKTARDLQRLQKLRFDAFLIGERFMTAPDPGAALAALLAEAAGGEP